MTGSILSYQQENSIKLLCELDLKKLFSSPKERDKFDNKWNKFLDSYECNKDIFKRKGDSLKYQSEQLIPTEIDNRPPLLLILGNPASHSVKEGMFFSFEGDKKEHRFWKILRKSKALDLPIERNLSVEEQNYRRKRYLLELKYETPFRVGLCVFLSTPSKASGKWSGVAGVQRLIGAKALKELEKEECQRVTECAKKFLTPKGVVVTFQKNAWNGLKSERDIPYRQEDAKNGKLIGTLKGMPNIPLLCAPPTRLSGPCSRILRQLLNEQGYKLLAKNDQ